MAELAMIDRWLDLAADGHPRVGVVTGPPGVGKSHLLGSVAQRAAARGFKVLRGAGFESTPPLVPVLTALDPLVGEARAGRRHDLTENDRATLALLLGPGPGSAAPSSTKPIRTDDTAVYLTASRLLLGATQLRPVVLVIDDAHELDGASAALIAHLVSAAAHRAEEVPVSLLTVLATRPAPASGPVRRTLGRVAQERGAAELALAGLDELELNEMLTSVGPVGPSRPLLHEVQARTGGNPLYARLLWTHLIGSGAAVEVDGRMVVGDPNGGAFSASGLDDVIDVHLDALDPATRRVLEVAAILGPAGDIADLAAVLELDRAEVEEAVAEADRARVCRIEGDRYRFDHPLLAAAISRPLALGALRDLHLRVAGVLAGRDEPPVLDLLEHLRAAGPGAPEADRLRWGLAGAERAMEIGAWGSAVAGYEMVLGAVSEAPPPGLPSEVLASVHRGAVRASAADHDLASCERFATAAVQHAEAHDDLELWCDVITELGHARVRVVSGGEAAPVDDLKAFLERVGDDAPRLQARVLALLAEAHFAVFDFSGGLEHARHADRLARATGDGELQAFVHFALALQHQGRFELDESDRRFAASQEVGAPDLGRADAPASGWARARLPSAHWIRGRLVDAEETAVEAMAEVEARLDWAELSLLEAWRACVAGARGDLGEATRLAERALVLHHRCDYAFTPVVAQPVLAIARALQGSADVAHEGLARWRAVRPSRWIDRLDVLVDALAGDVDAVRGAVRSGRWRTIAPESLDMATAATAAAQVEVAAVAMSPDLAEPVRRPLEDLHLRGVRFVPGSLSLVSRLCAVAARSVGDLDDAWSWSAIARQDATAAGAEAEAARCDLDDAILARQDQRDPDQIDHLLTRASAAFDRLGMLALLRRSEEELGAVGRTSTVRSLKVVLFTDLVGSTSINVRSGDDAYLRMLRAHDRVLRDALRRHDGVEFKHTGDGMAAWFAAPRQAVRCALDLQGSIAAAVLTDTGTEIAIRCGLAAGEPIEVDGDLFGLAVSRAARICDRAVPGTVLVADDVPPLVADAEVTFVDRGEVDLRGLPTATRIFEARPSASSSSATSPAAFDQTTDPANGPALERPRP